MLNSLYSGVSGLKGFQTKLDVIGNNIANVNTVGFKKSSVMFQDIISQNISAATGPRIQPGADGEEQYGGVNPKQIGLGTQVGSIGTIYTPGSPTSTGVGTDLAINGDAFFVVAPKDENPNTDAYLESTNKYLTKAGNFKLDGDGNLVDSNGNFVVGETGAGREVIINISSDQFTSFSIDANGYINVVNKDGETGYLAAEDSDSYSLKEVVDGEIQEQGKVISIQTAVVTNPGGLNKIGGNLYEETANSGTANFGRIAENGGGTINSGTLEMSNVDLTEEFTELIVAQRGFQANARTITTSDSILEEVVNLKR